MKHKFNYKCFFRPKSLLKLLFVAGVALSIFYNYSWPQKRSTASVINLSFRLQKMNASRYNTIKAWVQQDELAAIEHFSTKKLIYTFETLNKYLINNANDIKGQVIMAIQSQNIIFEWLDEAPGNLSSFYKRIEQVELWNNELIQIQTQAKDLSIARAKLNFASHSERLTYD
ncbi:MAG: hypothetical protein AABY64_03705 [Bdellovibrionota bacterium]